MLASPTPHAERQHTAPSRRLSLSQQWGNWLQTAQAATRPSSVPPRVDSNAPPAIDNADDFQRARPPYAAIETVTPVFSEALNRDIQAAMQRYEYETGRLIPPAYRFPRRDSPGQWASNKAERLTPVVWVLAQLPPAADDQEAINQVAAVLHVVDGLARSRYAQVAHLYLPDPRPLRLTVPLSETVQSQRLLVSLGIRHVTLFKPDGAIQIQTLPPQPEMLNYPQRAQNPDWVFFTKSGQSGRAFWS